MPGFAGVTRPASVPTFTSSAFQAILGTGAVPMTSTTSAPGFAATGSVDAPGSSSAPAHVRVGTCLAEGGSILAVDMTTQTGDEWQLVGALVSQPSAEPATSGTSRTDTVDYLFRGTVTQIAGVAGTPEGLPWNLPPDFVAEVQVLEPSSTASLTVVFVTPTGRQTGTTAATGTGTTQPAATPSAAAGSTGASATPHVDAGSPRVAAS
ncbi:MAG: hypothetical protein ACRDWE_07805 [Acidimicrobiales bacterium]